MLSASEQALSGAAYTNELIGAAGGHEGGAGGLPQFDPAWWPGQIFWVLVIFLVVFVLMKWVFVPKVAGAIDGREGRIAGDIAEARRLKDAAEVQASEAKAELDAARSRAQRVAADAKARATTEARARQGAEEAKLAETLAAAEAGIKAAREQAMSNVRTIAGETATAIVAKLSGAPASAQEVERALAGRA